MAATVPCPDCGHPNAADGSGVMLCERCGRAYRAPPPASGAEPIPWAAVADVISFGPTGDSVVPPVSGMGAMPAKTQPAVAGPVLVAPMPAVAAAPIPPATQPSAPPPSHTTQPFAPVKLGVNPFTSAPPPSSPAAAPAPAPVPFLAPATPSNPTSPKAMPFRPSDVQAAQPLPPAPAPMPMTSAPVEPPPPESPMEVIEPEPPRPAPAPAPVVAPPRNPTPPPVVVAPAAVESEPEPAPAPRAPPKDTDFVGAPPPKEIIALTPRREPAPSPPVPEPVRQPEPPRQPIARVPLKRVPAGERAEPEVAPVPRKPAVFAGLVASAALGAVGALVGPRFLPPSLFQSLDSVEVRAGNAQLRSGDVSGAIERYRRVVDRHPDCSIAWRNLGVAYALAQSPDKAAEAYEAFLRLEPASPDASRVRQLLARSEKP